MKNIAAIHQNAMEKADFAVVSKLEGDANKSLLLFAEAFSLEKEAALLAVESDADEPTRYILLRSAASLALDARLASEAEKLICMAIANEPPQEIANELRRIIESIGRQEYKIGNEIMKLKKKEKRQKK